MTIDWRPDRGIRRTVLVLGAAGLTLIATGAVLDVLWLLGIGVWGVIAAMMVELVYRP
ncbi:MULTISPECIES: hypothetical protein [unclassified Streptomyces]|uniref:hypothetical protein n=1 Tax=unclassified Streptomyces TaxID=2593676 RepID=UPI0013A69E75|nr:MULTISPECIES: hypothetical protein [unclassified Streptomyces]